MKNYHLPLIVLVSISLVACAPRITRTDTFATSTPTTATPTTSPPTVSTATGAPSVALASTPASLPTSSFIDNPATFTHSNTLPTGTPPSLHDYADYDSYLAAYYNHYGRHALMSTLPAVLSSQPSSSSQLSNPPISPTPVLPNTTAATPTIFTTHQPIHNTPQSPSYNQIISQANQAVAQANAALAQATQAQPQVTSSVPNPSTSNITNMIPTASASSVASQSGTLTGSWQGNAIDNIRGTNTGMQFVLTQRNNQLGGEVYFETVNGLEFFGQLQGRLAGNNATITLRYQDGSYTYFTGDFGASFFTGEYQYITSTGQSLASGTVRLRRQ